MDSSPRLIFLFVALALIVLLSSSPGGEHKSASSPSQIALYKDFVDQAVSEERIDAFLRYLTAEPHVASSPRNNELADYLLQKWKEFGLDEVSLAKYDVLLSFPREICVELVSPRNVSLKIQEKGYPEDPDTMNPAMGIPYNAYSRSGDITAPLVYANGGNPEDYDLLGKKGIDLNGKIALVRYSSPYSYRGFKALTAEKKGLAGILIYSDPREDGSARGDVFPKGPWGPPSHIQRGGIPYDFIYPGDPLTPEWASKPGAERLSREEALTLPKILSVPLSAENALPLLESLDGEIAPKEWQGALPLVYRLSGSQAKVRMRVEMEDPIKTITNVIGCIKGSGAPEEVVLVGNHRDAWVYGGVDPSSGTSCLMELARALGAAKKQGFKPRRSIYFASWDAEEFTLTGSTEWGEENRDWLRENLVAYINVDSSASGRKFSIQGVPSLIPLVDQALQEVDDPVEKKPVYEVWKSAGKKSGRTEEQGRMEPIGSGSDHAVFLEHIGAPAIDMSFGGDYGVYHSAYDNYYWMSHFGDPGMRYTAALVKIWARMIIDLACRPLLPLDFETYGRELQKYLGDRAEKHDLKKSKSQALFALFRKMEKAASRIRPYLFDPERARKIAPEALKKANKLLLSIERDFTNPSGIPGRPWYKHLIFGAHTTYDVLLLPELAEAAEAGDDQRVATAIRNLEKAAAAVTAKLEQIAALIGHEVLLLNMMK